MEWFDKLKSVKEFLDSAADTGADWLTAGGDLAVKIGEAMKDAAKAIDPTPTRMGTAAAAPLGAVRRGELEAFAAECEESRGQVGFGAEATAAGPGAAVLLDLLIWTVREILARRRQ